MQRLTKMLTDVQTGGRTLSIHKPELLCNPANEISSKLTESKKDNLSPNIDINTKVTLDIAKRGIPSQRFKVDLDIWPQTHN